MALSPTGSQPPNVHQPPRAAWVGPHTGSWLPSDVWLGGHPPGVSPALPWEIKGQVVRWKPQTVHSFRDLRFGDQDLQACLVSALWTRPPGTSLPCVCTQSPTWGGVPSSFLVRRGVLVLGGVSAAGCWLGPLPWAHRTLGAWRSLTQSSSSSSNRVRTTRDPEEVSRSLQALGSMSSGSAVALTHLPQTWSSSRS